MRGWSKPLLGLAICALAVAYFIVWQAPAAGTFHDDAVYMVTAKALAEGKGYRIISLPQEVPQTKYPALFPLLLSTVWRWFPQFPGNVPYLKLVALISALIWFLLIGRLLEEEGASSRIACIIALLTASCSWVIYLSASVLSETLFSMLTAGALLFLRRAERGESIRTVAIAALFASLAFHTRSIGVALLIAGPVALAIRRKWVHAISFTFICTMLCSPWLLWVAVNRHAAAVDGYASLANYQSWNVLIGFTAVQKLHIVAMNALAALAAPASLAGLPTASIYVLPAVLTGVVIIAGMRLAGAQTLTIFVCAYATVTVLWAWAPSRLLVPVLPLLYWFGYLRIAPYRRISLATAVLLLVTAVVSVTKPARQALALGDAQPGLSDGDDWYRMHSLMRWVKHNTPEQAVLAGNLDAFYYLSTGRKAVRGFQADPYPLIYSPTAEPIGTLPQILSQLQSQRASYWILSPNSAFREGAPLRKLQDDSLLTLPSQVERLHAGVAESHDVLRLRIPDVTSSRSLLR